MRVLMVHTYPGANETVKRHYPFYEKAGFDKIFGVTTEGGGCYWPTPRTVELGRNAYVGGPELSRRLVSTLESALFFGADEVCVIEYDVLFFKPIPSAPKHGIAMVRTGGGSPGFKSSNFYHVPWLMNAATARLVISVGKRLLAAGDFEQGSPDRFIGLIVDCSGLPVHEDVFTRYTRNTIASPEELAEARAAYLGGVHAMHGIKTKEQLDFVTKS
jgi:hypothetical protein